MIVKNEEDCIERCLQSVKDAVDEMIIVDTGCTDQTIEICQSFGAIIYPFQWNGSFADARNYGIEQANHDWVLWLDADEEVDSVEVHKLRDADKFAGFDVLSIHLINYYGDTVDKNRTTDITHTRLFRRSTGIRFINKIHECLDIIGLDEKKFGFLNLKVHHYGYLDPVIEKKGKVDRNMKMLEKQVEADDNAYWAYYYMASEKYRTRDWKEAYDLINLSIRKFLLEGLLPPSMVYKLKYQTLIAMGSFEGAWPAIDKAIELYPDYVDLYFFKGIILYHLEKYEDALKTFEQCLEMGEDNIVHLILKGVGSFQASHYMGMCYERLSRLEEAADTYAKALTIYPDYEPIQASLEKLTGKII